MKTSSLFLIAVILSFQTTVAQDWTFSTVAWGAKPSIDLDSQGIPHFAYIYEQSTTGWLRYAVWNPGPEQYDTTHISSGNYYGPPSIIVDHNDDPGINFHRHTPIPEQMYTHLDFGTWTTVAIASDNHDGWDNSLQFDSNNLPRTSTVDPIAFGGTATGVEYAAFNGTSWIVEAIGTPQINYFSSTSLELDANDNPHITYYDDITDDLKYAVKTGGSWTITSIESAGDVGRFASLELDSNGDPRVSYFVNLEDSMGLVKYASWNGSSWNISVVDTLKRVFLSLARNLTFLALDENDNPHISYGDEKVLKYATSTGGPWTIETLIDVNGLSTIIGQANSIAVAEDGTVHIAYYELLTRNPLTGIVKHARRDPGSAIGCGSIFFFNAKCNADGAAQAMVKMTGDFTGETVTFDLDGTNIVSNVMSNGTNSIAKMTVPHAGMGSHTVTLESPAGCYSPVVIDCQVDAPPDPEWDALWAEYEYLEAQALSNLPTETRIIGNYPNPFNPSTTIRYALGVDSPVSVRVYNMLGQEVATLVNRFQKAGEQSVVWHGTNNFGQSVASGLYVYRLQVGNMALSQKMLFAK